MTTLSVKQRLFCAEYIIDLNAAAAAVRAGYKHSTARQQASRLLTNVNIQAEIARLMAARRERLQVDADRVVQELMAVAFSRIDDFARIVDGEIILLDSVDIPANSKAALAEIQQTRNRGGKRTTVRLHDKLKALVALYQHLGIPEARSGNGNSAEMEALLHAAGYTNAE